MEDKEVRSGRCLCGGIRVTVTKPLDGFGLCHCAMCRRWTGGPFFAVGCETDISFEGAQNIEHYRSSDWAERGFCRTCGTHLYYREVSNGHVHLSLGVLDETADLEMKSQIFIDEKPAHYDFSNQTTNMTGEEVFALFAPED
ncbi:MAG: GFA family protein [Rhodospirillales bacterium]|nr:GFA family protein [Rhodospirillales bacterium]